MKIDTTTSLAATVAAEDLHPGDMIAVLNEVCEYPSFLWNLDGQMSPPEQPVRIRWRANDGGTPLRVEAVCLPFVLLKDPAGVYRTVDVRQCDCVRLNVDYARLAWKRLQRGRKRGARRRR
ncbi:MAG: hypothetical protein KDA75_16495 [Planctomycetaceae bacterium]|nr:hypothetical protein [Planctomycetaceae bacterium]